MKMTKREALEICIKMWDWLAEHPGAEKWKAVHALRLPEDMPDRCAACAYDEQFAERTSCNHCPVWTGDCTCTAEGSPYLQWARSGRLDCTAAKGVADLARKRLNALEELTE